MEALCHRLRDAAPACIRLHRSPDHAMQPCGVNGSVAVIRNDAFHVAKQLVALGTGQQRSKKRGPVARERICHGIWRSAKFRQHDATQSGPSPTQPCSRSCLELADCAGFVHRCGNTIGTQYGTIGAAGRGKRRQRALAKHARTPSGVCACGGHAKGAGVPSFLPRARRLCKFCAPLSEHNGSERCPRCHPGTWDGAQAHARLPGGGRRPRLAAGCRASRRAFARVEHAREEGATGLDALDFGLVLLVLCRTIVAACDLHLHLDGRVRTPTFGRCAPALSRWAVARGDGSASAHVS